MCSDSRGEVTVYSHTGWQEDLPRLGQPRSHHACASYVREDGQKVTVSNADLTGKLRQTFSEFSGDWGDVLITHFHQDPRLHGGPQ